MASIKKLFGSAFIYAMSNGLYAGLPLLLMPVLTRIMTPEDYGKVTMFVTTLAIMSAFTGLSVSGAVNVRYYDQDRYHLPSYVKTCLLILLLSTSVVFGVVFLFQLPLERIAQIPGKWLLFTVLVSGAQFLIQMRLTLWQASNQPVKYGLLRIGQSAVTAVAILWLVKYLDMGWQGNVLGHGGIMLGFALFALVFLLGGGWFSGHCSTRYAKDALQFGVPLIPHVIGGMLLAMIGRVMIANMLSVEQVGIYMVSLQVGMGLGLLTDSFNKAYAPYLFRTLKTVTSKGRLALVRFTYYYLVIVMLIATFLGIFAPDILSLVAGEKFRAASGTLIFIAAGFAFNGMYFMVTNYIFYEKKTAYLSGLTLACGCFNAAISYFLIMRLGLTGAAIGFMCAQALLFIGTWIIAHKVHPMPWYKGLFYKAA